MGSLVRPRATDTVTDRGPFLARGLASDDPSCPPLNHLSPRLLDGWFIVICRTLKADQELGDQVGAFLLGERECPVTQRLRVIGHGEIGPLDLDGSARDPPRATHRTSRLDGATSPVERRGITVRAAPHNATVAASHVAAMTDPGAWQRWCPSGTSQGSSTGTGADRAKRPSQVNRVAPSVSAQAT